MRTKRKGLWRYRPGFVAVTEKVLNYLDTLEGRESFEWHEKNELYFYLNKFISICYFGVLLAHRNIMGEFEKIVIVDEAGFSRICLSILREKGFCAESLVQGESELPRRFMEGASLLITSYPYGESILSRLRGMTVPVIILADHVGKEIIEILEGLENSYCMVKPIDYRKFTLLVKDLVRTTVFHYGGYSIV